MNREAEQPRSGVTSSKEAYAIVGELVLTASALDHQLNHIAIAVFALSKSTMLEPVVATIDSQQKVRMLKAYAGHIREPSWRRALLKHLDLVETVNSGRNLAAHSILTEEKGGFVLSSPAAAKIMKALDLGTKSIKRTPISQLQETIAKGQRALTNGIEVLENFRRYAEQVEAMRERKRTQAPKANATNSGT